MPSRRVMRKLLEFGVGFTAYGSLTIGGMHTAARIAEERNVSAAAILAGYSCQLVFCRRAGAVRADDHVAKGVAVFAPGGKFFANQTGLVHSGCALRRWPEHSEIVG